MKENIKLGFSCFVRLICAGGVNLVLYFAVMFLVISTATQVCGARIYQATNGEYVQIDEVRFEDPDTYKPPEGDDLKIVYFRNDPPAVVTITVNVLLQVIMIYIAFRLMVPVLSIPGKHDEKRFKLRGFLIGALAAVPAFAVYVAYIILISVKWAPTRTIYCILNISFRPLIDYIYTLTANTYSVSNAIITGVIILLIVAITELAYLTGNRIEQIDVSQVMYKKKEEENK